MIYTYGITQQGTYHKEKNTVCQDAHQILKCRDDFVIAAVADGLGSEEYSDRAAKIAVEISTDYCSKNIEENLSDTEILKVIKDSFSLAQSEIEKEALENGHDLDQYDTTLSLAVLIKDNLYIGQSGDSGIVVFTSEGLYKSVTKQQRDEIGRVFPLYFGEDKWVFNKVPESVVSVFLATDGMLETLFPVYIKNEPVNIYVALARYFIGPDFLNIEENGEEVISENIGAFLESIPDEQVYDDKTVVGLINSDISFSLQEPEYYKEPNWDELKKKFEETWRREAYPSLFSSEEDEESKTESEDLK